MAQVEFPVGYRVSERAQAFFAAYPFRDFTFDEAVLIPRESAIHPNDASVAGWFSRRIPLEIAMCSAAMDTVTEADMAIAMAKLGGIGVLHKGCTEDEQARMVDRVKHALHKRIDKPITVIPDMTLEQVLAMKAEHGFDFDTFPVIDGSGSPIGMITGRTFKYARDRSRRVGDVMVTEVVYGTPETTIEQAYELMNTRAISVLPLRGEDGLLAGMYIHKDVVECVEQNRKGYTLDERGKLRVAAAVGMLPGNEARIEALVRKDVDALVIDSSHGHARAVLETLRELRRQYGDLDIVVGNVSSADGIAALMDAGADGIKVGQGPGSICTTRLVTGSGRPQLSAIYDVARAVSGEVPVIGDGGFRHSGDLVKGFAVGASAVMLGGMLAACTEAPGEVIEYDGKAYKVYRGMGSRAAMFRSAGAAERYFQEGREPRKLVAEGIEGAKEYKGPVADVIAEIAGGIRSGLGLNGAADISALQRNAYLREQGPAGDAEGRPHDVMRIAPVVTR